MCVCVCVCGVQYKPSSHHKGPYEFDRVRLRQDLTGPHLVSYHTSQALSVCVSLCVCVCVV